VKTIKLTPKEAAMVRLMMEVSKANMVRKSKGKNGEIFALIVADIDALIEKFV